MSPGRQIAAVDDLERRHQLAAEQLGPAAVVGQRRQRTQHRQIAHADAEVALQRPERDDHRARHAVILLGLRQQLAMLLQRGVAVVMRFCEISLPEKAVKVCAKKPCLRSREMMPGSSVMPSSAAGDGGVRHAAGARLLAELVEPALEAAGVPAVGIVRLGGLAGVHGGRRCDSAHAARISSRAPIASLADSLSPCPSSSHVRPRH